MEGLCVSTDLSEVKKQGITLIVDEKLKGFNVINVIKIRWCLIH
jgi:hypothetical protein